jgi:hypothetical protein
MTRLILTTFLALTSINIFAAEKINHVFIIVLENEGFNTTFGPNSPAPYLSKTLPAKGAFLRQYYGTGHASLDNYISMISGQAATSDTRNDCQTYADFKLTGTTPDGQAMGSGCIYPATVPSIVDQLRASNKTWRAYMEDMGNDPNRESSTCGHPALNTTDLTQTAEAPSANVPDGDQYATRHNPFSYFHSIIDNSDCNTNVVNLNQLSQDLQSVATTPNYVFITPNLCHDGHDSPCMNGEPGGLVSADQFLQKWVPAITSSPAYSKSGLLMILFDEGDIPVTSDGKGGYIINAPGLFCCNQQPGPNLTAFPQSSTIGPYTLSFQSYGGDRTGAVLLSPFIRPGTVSDVPYNHYSMLKTVEDIFNLDYLGYAAAPGLQGFFGCVNSGVENATAGQFATCK